MAQVTEQALYVGKPVIKRFLMGHEPEINGPESLSGI
jgi:hypothetical protein